jgi:hypothetical protein
MAGKTQSRRTASKAVQVTEQGDIQEAQNALMISHLTLRRIVGFWGSE